MTKKRKATNQEIAQILEDFLEARGKPLAWDGYTLGRPFEDEHLEEIRMRCANLSRDFPPDRPNEYCKEQGRGVIRGYVEQLRASG